MVNHPNRNKSAKTLAEVIVLRAENAKLRNALRPFAIAVLHEEVERLRTALKAIADDPDTNVEATVYARNSIASSLERVS